MSVKLVKPPSDRPDPAEFRIPASDTKGHSARLWFRCMPSMARQVEQVIQSKQFPYRTKGDLCRHALHQHMRWLQGIEDVPSVSGQVDAILEIMRDEEFSNDFMTVFEKLNDRISGHISQGADSEARRLILMVQRHIAEMPDGYWKTRYQKELRTKYGKLLGSGGAGLGYMEED